MVERVDASERRGNLSRELLGKDCIAVYGQTRYIPGDGQLTRIRNVNAKKLVVVGDGVVRCKCALRTGVQRELFVAMSVGATDGPLILFVFVFVVRDLSPREPNRGGDGLVDVATASRVVVEGWEAAGQKRTKRTPFE